MGMRLAQGLAKQVTPFGGQAVAWDLIDLYPGIIFQTAFGDDQMDMWFEAKVAAEGMDCIDLADAQAVVDVVNDFTHGPSGNLQEEFQQRAVGVEERPQEVIGSESDVQMGHIEHVLGDIVDQVVHADLPA